MPESPELSITITGKDVWDKLVAIEKEVSGLPRMVADHEARIRILEKRSVQFATVAAMIGALGGGGLAQLFRVVGS